MKTYQQFLTEASAGKPQGISKEEWDSRRTGGFDPKSASLDRYLATKGSDFKAFAWEGISNRELDINIDGATFTGIDKFVPSNADADFKAADQHIRRFNSKVFTYGPTIVPKGGKWVLSSKLAKALTTASTNFSKDKSFWKGATPADFINKFKTTMTAAGFNDTFDPRKQAFKDKDVNYAYQVMLQASK